MLEGKEIGATVGTEQKKRVALKQISAQTSSFVKNMHANLDKARLAKLVDKANERAQRAQVRGLRG